MDFIVGQNKLNRINRYNKQHCCNAGAITFAHKGTLVRRFPNQSKYTKLANII